MCVVVTVRPLANLLEGLFCKKKKKNDTGSIIKLNHYAWFNKERQSNVIFSIHA